jgi:hypothetical protein
MSVLGQRYIDAVSCKDGEQYRDAKIWPPCGGALSADIFARKEKLRLPGLGDDPR